MYISDDKPNGKAYHHNEQCELEADVCEEVLLVTFTDTITDPWAVMIKCGHASFTLPAVLSSQRLIVLAFSTVAKLNVYASFSQVSLYSGLIFGTVEFGEDPSVHLSRHRDCSLQLLLFGATCQVDVAERRRHRDLSRVIKVIFVKELDCNVYITVIILVSED